MDFLAILGCETLFKSELRWNQLRQGSWVVDVQSIDLVKVRLIDFGRNKKLCMIGPPN